MKGTGATSGHPLFWTAFSRVSFSLGSGRECWRSTVGCCWQGVGPHSLGSPPVWFKNLSGMAHSQAMWPQPWHWKHWSELGSFLFEVLPCPSLGPWAFPWPWPVVPVLWPADMLQVEVVWSRPVWPLWELGWLEVVLSVLPLPWPLCLGLFGVLPGLLSCPALVRAAISLIFGLPAQRLLQLAWWSQLTLPTPCLRPLHFHSPPWRQGPEAGSMWYQGCYKGSVLNLLCVFIPHERDVLWGAAAPLHLWSCWGTKTGFDLGFLPALWQRMEPSHGCFV